MGSPVNDHASIVNCHIMSKRSAGVRDSQYTRSAPLSLSEASENLDFHVLAGIHYSLF